MRSGSTCTSGSKRPTRAGCAWPRASLAGRTLYTIYAQRRLAASSSYVRLQRPPGGPPHLAADRLEAQALVCLVAVTPTEAVVHHALAFVGLIDEHLEDIDGLLQAGPHVCQPPRPVLASLSSHVETFAHSKQQNAHTKDTRSHSKPKCTNDQPNVPATRSRRWTPSAPPPLQGRSRASSPAAAGCPTQGAQSRARLPSRAPSLGGACAPARARRRAGAEGRGAALAAERGSARPSALRYTQPRRSPAPAWPQRCCLAGGRGRNTHTHRKPRRQHVAWRGARVERQLGPRSPRSFRLCASVASSQARQPSRLPMADGSAWKGVRAAK